MDNKYFALSTQIDLTLCD